MIKGDVYKLKGDPNNDRWIVMEICPPFMGFTDNIKIRSDTTPSYYRIVHKSMLEKF